MNTSTEKELVFDPTSATANKTLTGELATAEKIAAYHLDIPPLGFKGKLITIIELIGLIYVMYLTGDFMVGHITHMIHLFSH
ncbi:MAG: hypothetical protein HZA78_10045 [Candidatus Schekmanbacteria bacterium]|nr:hypothetical protein [Candidatus Schekmanbacteria bacterium]